MSLKDAFLPPKQHNQTDQQGNVWPLLLSFVVLSTAFYANVFSVIPNGGNWITYILFALTITFVIFASNHLNDSSRQENQKFVISAWFSASIYLLIVIGLIGKTASAPIEGVSIFRMVVTPILLVTVSAIGFIVSSRSIPGILRIKSVLILPVSVAILVTYLLGSTRIGIQTVNLKPDLLLATSIAAIIGLVLGLIFASKPKSSKHPKFYESTIILGFLVILSAILSFRVDQIFNIAGAKFHWSYFTGAIDTLRSGGTLLWDTPSQYGLGPIFIPTLLPINNSTTAFLIFQSTLMVVTVGFGLYVLKRISSSLRSFVVLGLIWILVYFFADPALIGPQPYPSSSAVRFGPSLIFASFLLLTLFAKLRETKPYVYKIGFPLIGAVSFCWSAESAIYSLAIFGAYILGSLLYGEERNFRTAALKPLLLIATGVVTAILLICILVFTRVGHLPDFGMFFMYSRGYAEGFGSYGLEFASPVWLLVLVVSLLSVSWVIGTKTEKNRTFIRMTIVLVGATGAWFSYFVGRAVPDNVIAMLPLIVFSLLVVVAFATPLSSNKHLTVAGEVVAKPVFLWSLSVVAVLLTISTLVLTNPIVKMLTPGWLPSFQSSVKPLPWTDEALAPPALISALSSIPAEFAELPIAYEGYHGVLLKTEGALNWTPNTSQVWIPAPLGLLEEPIPAAKQEQILSRFLASSPRDGLFIWDIKNSFPDRAERWKQLIQQTHSCHQVYLSEDYEILQCSVIK